VSGTRREKNQADVEVM